MSQEGLYSTLRDDYVSTAHVKHRRFKRENVHNDGLRRKTCASSILKYFSRIRLDGLRKTLSQGGRYCGRNTARYLLNKSYKRHCYKHVTGYGLQATNTKISTI